MFHNDLDQGFSTFGYLCTPKAKLNPICVPQNQKFYLNEFFLIFHTPYELLTYPRLRTVDLDC